jgi:cyclophilin family peptidyl-prolyl cis-trans isomerase/HEAT repeat protein
MRIVRFIMIFSLVTLGCGSGDSANRDRLLQIEQLEDQGTLGPNRDLMTLIYHTDLAVRERALWALGRIEDASVVDELAQAATLDTLPLYRAAAWCMGQLGPIAASNSPSNYLQGLFKDPDPLVRRNVLDGVSRLSDPGLPDFVEIFGLMEGDPVVRGAAAVAEWRLGDTQHIRDLISLLRDQVPDVRWRAAFALWRLKDPHAKSAVEAALADPDVRVRMFAARALGEIGDDISSDSLVTLLDDADWRVRNDAAAALGKIARTDRVIDRLAQKLENEPHELAASTMAEALGKLGRKQDWPVLKGLIRRRSGTIWQGMINGAAAGYPDSAVVLAGVMLKDPRTPVAATAISALGRIGSESARALIATNYMSLDETVRGFAISALSEFGFNMAEPFIDEALQSTNLVLAVNAVDVLSKCVDTLGKGADTTAGRRLSEFWQRHASDTVSDFKTAALNTAGVLCSANVALGPVMQPWMTMALQDSDRLVRKAAIDAFARMGRDESDELGTFRSEITDKNYNAMFRAYSANPKATIKTDRGDITIELRYDVAPRTVYNFVKLAKAGFYDGTIFHRVVPNFVIQGGDPTGTGYGGPGYTIRSQYSDLEYSTGAVGMASSGKDTEGSQFFITHSPQPHLDDRYTIFGYVTEGQNIVDEIRIGDKINSIVIAK